jgi:hypothetical protein
MTWLMLLFVVVFVLAVAGVCALVVLRLLGDLQLPDSPPFPRKRRGRKHGHPAAPKGAPTPEELAEKR